MVRNNFKGKEGEGGHNKTAGGTPGPFTFHGQAKVRRIGLREKHSSSSRVEYDQAIHHAQGQDVSCSCAEMAFHTQRRSFALKAQTDNR